ncbi:TPA: peptidylprolyl isomerase [Acinetobacter baumannii]|uniref:peptidylprolyl isomerase n=1 Tax=Acinetobacter baumannii TaxID=470 RepID=UPI00280EDECA|nr:peptidylprolyl isomerase [Acinetobacter baumannii]MDQ8814354.1 peptidylprolyl isomerase [Acinetobacter baumannii]HCQ9540025.1 peptidylprolyl isomerase [Acinetobacter baumannii]HCQ9555012.1 peptidylprolyl isomerase [Acinetobacter baumannii]HCQ9752319.1 peptidylprolyl isomerase [Acinetobacter baumannii]HCQ9828588.1 peptidylprolyl isomerase [Acinetobacter baumannii]
MKTKHLKQFFKATTLAVLISSSMHSFAQPTDEVVAIVDNSVILKSDLEQGMAEAAHELQAQKKEVPPQQYLQFQVLDQLILRQAQLEQVKKYGIKPDEKSLNEAVLKVASQSGSKSLEAFQQKLDAIAPGTYENLRSRIAEDLAINRLRQQQVMSRIKISDQDVDNFLKSPQGQAALGNQAHVIHMRISGDNPQEVQNVAKEVRSQLAQSNDLNALKKLSTATVKVEGADMRFRPLSDIPAELAARITPLQDGQTTDLISVRDGVHVLKLLERKQNEQKALVPQYQTRHILIQPSEVVSPENAKQIIDSIYKRLKAGEDFAILAATYSNDTGSARDGGSLGWVTPGMMVPEFDKKMQEIPVGEISEPFQTQFGWHILQVTDKREKDMTHEYQERMARQILGERQFNTEIDSWLREVRANAYVEIKDPSLDKKNLQK